VTNLVKEAENIKRCVMECRLCNDFETKGICITHKEIGLNYAYPKKAPITILFVAESPPAQGKGFFYDESHNNTIFRDTLFEYINLAGLGPVHGLQEFNNKGYYLADAINCRWDKSKQKRSFRK
jgi:hypothetical protein